MKYCRLLVVVFCGAWAFATQSHAASLTDAIKTAIATNPSIEAAQASRRATEFALKQAQGRFLPEVDLRADAGKEKIDRPQGLGPLVNNRWRVRRQASINVRQVLFDGWDRANDVYRSQARISAASFRILARTEALGLNVVEAYIDVVRHQNLLRLSRKNVDRHRTLLGLIRERFEGGGAPVGDVEQTIERVEAAKALVAQIQISLDTSIAKYKNAVGEKPYKLRPVRLAPGIPKSVKSATATALSNNPRLQAAAAEIDVAKFDKEQFRSSFFPQLSLEGTATRGENLGGTPGRNDELRGMVVLTWRLFDGGIRRNRDFELAERYAETFAEQRILARQVVQEIEIAWARYSHGREQVSSLKKQVLQNARVLTTYQDEYNANKRSLLDLLDAENANFGSQFSLSNASALYSFASYQILAQSGTLLSKLGIPAPDEAAVFAAPYEFKELYGAKKSIFSIPPLR